MVEISEWLNRVTGGPKDYSLCARLWEDRLNGKPHAKSLVALLDFLFMEKGHCKDAWQWRQHYERTQR